jgi:hypothetical protein
MRRVKFAEKNDKDDVFVDLRGANRAKMCLPEAVVRSSSRRCRMVWRLHDLLVSANLVETM